MSTHGRRSLGPERAGPGQSGLVQFGWALLVIAAALIGGLAAATLVHASLTIAVIVSVAVGGIAVLAVFRSPARPPELRAGEPEDEDFGRYPAPRRRPAPPAAQSSQPPRGRRAASPASAGPDPTVPSASFASAGPGPTVPAASFASAGPDPTAPIPAEPDGQIRGGPPGGTETVVQLLPLPPQPGNAEPPDAPWWDSAQGAPPPPSPGARRAPAPDLSTYLASTFIAQCPRCGAFRLDIRQARNGWDFRCESCGYTWTWQPGTPWPPVRVMPRGRKE